MTRHQILPDRRGHRRAAGAADASQGRTIGLGGLLLTGRRYPAPGATPSMTQPTCPCRRVIAPACCAWWGQPPGRRRSMPAGETVTMSGGARSPRRTSTLAIAALAIVATLLAATALTLASSAALPPTPVSTSITALGEPGLLGPRRLLLEQHIRPTAADMLPGNDSCVRVLRYVDIGGGTIVFESRRRITPTSAGTVTERRATVAAGADAATVDRYLRAAAAICATYGPGELTSPVGDPVPADADVLAARITAALHHFGADGLRLRAETCRANAAVLVDLLIAADVPAWGTRTAEEAIGAVLYSLPAVALTLPDPAGIQAWRWPTPRTR
ncbi:hypothetical protein AB0K00_40225 [Dactylosporangium sp. NPDC049525]|uniref:hypothetical protein n=1 Tax=Dactylosporangium sp. NPDC049525 TaxID=3154730 RepID=UPI003435749F